MLVVRGRAGIGKSRLVRELADWVRDVGGTAHVLRLMVEWSSPDVPALLVIEDLHWADRETLEVIEYLADHLSGQAALVVATLRDDEPGPGDELVSALWARRAIQPICLATLRI
jgi:predicted ATPase